MYDKQARAENGPYYAWGVRGRRAGRPAARSLRRHGAMCER